MTRPDEPPSDETPDVPRLRTWRGVYAFTIACFVVYVLLLTLLTHHYR